MSLMRSAAVACLLLVFANTGSNAVDEKPAQDLILGKWLMEFEEKVGKDKNVAFFMELEFRNEGKAKMTFKLGDPVIKEDAREGTYRLIDKSTLELHVAPPGLKEPTVERFDIVLLTEDRLTVRAKGKDGLLRFHRVK